VFLIAAVVTFSQQDRINAELCASTVENRDADRIQWLTLERLIVPTIDAEEARERFHALIQGVLRPIPALECRDDKPVTREG